jgi:iron complex outermembrane receptor protein/outer membrane receptor for ferrienterochelin and colicins
MIKGTVKNATTKEVLQSVSVTVSNTKKGTITDSIGNFLLRISNIADSKITLRFSYEGFEKKDTVIKIAASSPLVLNIELNEAKKQLEDVVIVSSMRTNSRIEDLPTKVEVLGAEEVGDENQIKPGNIVGLLGDFAGIQIQQTSAATGNADMRIQGLQGKYTQILRDGIPLFGGYSGSFSILQIAPLDLQQIELVKGASSTLYGGGAIAGMLNLVSKKPKLGAPERTLTINRSSLKENNLNAFFSARNKKFGYTFFTGGTLQKEVDVNGDGFSDVPNVKSFFIHPEFFVYASPSSSLVVDYALNYEDRKGGDMSLLDQSTDANHQFFVQNISTRNTLNIRWEQKLKNSGVFTAKASAGLFNREVVTNIFGMKADQSIWYSELAYTQKSKNHNWVVGVNFSGDEFKKRSPDSSLIPNESSNTLGGFIQDDWAFTKKFTLQAGLRLDLHSLYGNFLLPHLSLMYKATGKITMRLGGGLGYKTPTLFSTEVDERDYHYLSGYKAGTKAERSVGLNYDINYKTKMDDWTITFNQTFFYSQIKSPLLPDSLTNTHAFKYYNAGQPLETKGFETFVMMKQEQLEIYLGYVYTNAQRKYDAVHSNLPLIARNKLASLVSFELNEQCKAGLELSYIDQQYLDDGTKTSPYVIGAAMINYRFKNLSLVLNCENLFDFRQSKNNAIVFPPDTNPKFAEIWAPVEGRVLNLSAQLKL